MLLHLITNINTSKTDFFFPGGRCYQILDVYSKLTSEVARQAWKYPGRPINCGMPAQHKLDISTLTYYHKYSGLKDTSPLFHSLCESGVQTQLILVVIHRKKMVLLPKLGLCSLAPNRNTETEFWVK